MRYREITEYVSLLPLTKLARKAWKGRQDVYWHQCGDKDAEVILQSGFQTGKELQKGETTGSVFFTTWAPKGVSYVRGGQKAAYIPVITTGLNIKTDAECLAGMSEEDLDDNIQRMMFGGHWQFADAGRYQVKRWLDDGRIPAGLDGIILTGMKGQVYELGLTKDAANKALKRAIEEMKGLQ